MAYDQSTKSFTRGMRFETDADTENGDIIRQVDLDRAIDDVVTGMNALARDVAEYKDKATLLASGVGYDEYSTGDVIRAGDLVFQVVASDATPYHEVTTSGDSGSGGLRMVEAGAIFSSKTKAQQGYPLGAESIVVDGVAYTKDGSGTDLTTADSVTWSRVTQTNKSTARFDVGQAIYDSDPAELVKVQNHDTSQDVTAITNVIRDLFDDVMTFLQGGSERSALVVFPVGRIYVDREIFSDTFQEAWWDQTNLGKQKFLTIDAAPNGASILSVDSTWTSGVRNTANGDQRTYGPWANEPSPAVLMPAIADKTTTPAGFSVRNLRMKGLGLQGQDPIPFLTMNELDSKHDNVHIANFANWNELVMGSFNGVRSAMHWEACGAQPVESGAVLSGDAGFPTPRVVFDYDSSTNVLTAKAGSAFDTYAAGDTVPFFKTAHVGKKFVIYNAALQTGGQPLKVSITTVSADGVSTATVTPTSASVSRQSVTGVAGSFRPVRATTVANSASITLSSPVKVGRGAADMVGQLVAIPKAGSKTEADYDLFVSRVISCDTGNDTDGYTVLTLADQARDAVTEDFIWSVAHACVADEASLAAGTIWNVDDTDWLHCRWEGSGGYNDDVTTTGYMFISQDAGEGVQYVACKSHGANPLRGTFAADGQAIFDNADGVDLIGMDFTHQSFCETGNVRLMGAKGKLFGSVVHFGGWQMPHDSQIVYLDPQSGYDADDWRVAIKAPDVKNQYFPAEDQVFWGSPSGLNNIQTHRLKRHSDELDGKPILLDSTDNLDNIDVDGTYYWTTSAPSNGPGYPNNSLLEVITHGTAIYQRLLDLDNKWTFVREKWSGTWNGWRLTDEIRAKAGTALAADTNDINTIGKHTGLIVRNTTNDKLYYATGSGATDDWISADGADTITPV